MSPTSKKSPDLTISTRAADQLGLALRRFRDRADLTQTELAKSAGIRQATVSKAEKGLGTTEIKTIYAICAALGLEIVLRPRTAAGPFRVEDFF